MPAPSAQYIMSMLSPVPVYGSGNAIALANLGEQRVSRQEKARQFDIESKRAQGYQDLQRQQWEGNRADDLRDNRIKAYGAFQAAVDSGDTEQAALAANALRMLGVDVQEYGSGKSGATQAPASPGAMGAMAQESPTAAIAQAQAQGSSAEVPMPLPEQPKQATEPAKVPEWLRKDAEAGGYDQPLPATEEPVEVEEPGIRPSPARTQSIAGQEPKAAEAKNAAPIKGYRLSFDGNNIDIDPESVRERQRQRVASSLAPLLQNATTPEEQRAAVTAIQAAVNSVGTLKPNEAIEYGINLYKDPLDRGAKEKRARIVSGKGAGDGFGGVGDLSESKKKRLDVLNDDIRTYVQGFESKFDITNVRKGLDNGKKVADLLGSGNPVGQRAALSATLKGWFSSVTSDKELKFLLESSGKWASFENQYNNWVNGGELSDDFIRNLKEVTVIANDYYRRKLHDAGEQAAQGLLNDFTFTGRMTPEEAQAAADNIRGRFTGVYKTEKKKTGAPLVRGSKTKPAATPGPAKGSAAERARRLGY